MTSASISCPLKRYASSIIAENAYSLVDGYSALVVDPNRNPELVADLKAHDVSNVTVILTHEHPDHTCGVPLLENEFKLELACTASCADSIALKRNNMPTLVAMKLIAEDRANGKIRARKLMSSWMPYTCNATRLFMADDGLAWNGHSLIVKATPGHSKGSCCVEFDKEFVFTGDSLLSGTPVITRLPGGDKSIYENVTRPYLKSLVGQYVALPGHGEPFEITDIDVQIENN